MEDLGSGLRARLLDISSRLARRFGRPRRSPHRTEPLWNLILTILSQNTNDANRDKAFAGLKDRYRAFPHLAAAPQKDVEEAIRTAGLARAKAKAILSALSRVHREQGSYTLDFLSEMPLREAREYLVSFRGVGVKTANVVLLFSFGMDAFPVDTHILRVAKRLAIVPRTADLSRAALHLEPHVAAGDQMPLHMNMIRLGREVCRPRNPLCPECPLLPVCPEGARILQIRMGNRGSELRGDRRPKREEEPACMPAAGSRGGPRSPDSKSGRERARIQRIRLGKKTRQ